MILRIKVQEIHLTLQEHDDDDDVSHTDFVTSLEFGTLNSFPKNVFHTELRVCAELLFPN